MSTLKTVEKKYFEDMFNMNSGYVLDFTNNTFAAFFNDIVGIDIYTEKYAINGDSKAKRLRSFWDAEPDATVGKVLSELLEVWQYLNPQQKSSDSYNKCREISRRLLGKEVREQDSDKQFLTRDYGDISFDKMPIDSSLMPNLKSRLDEAHRCLQSNSPLAVIFLTGSVLEGVLLGVAIQRPREFNQAENSPKDKEGKVKPFHEWSLAQFIDVAYDLGLLKLDVKKFSHGLRDFRNYIHPYEQMASKFQPDKHTAEICLQVLKAAIASLSGDRR